MEGKHECHHCEKEFPAKELFFGYWATLCGSCRKILGNKN